MTLRIGPVTNADLSALHPDLPLPFFGWRARIGADPQVIDGRFAGPEPKPHRGHAGAAAVTLAESRVIGSSPSFTLSAPRLNMHKSATLEAA
jgi:hypothetical protein